MKQAFLPAIRVMCIRRSGKLIAYYFVPFLLRVGENDQCYGLSFYTVFVNNVQSKRFVSQCKDSVCLTGS